MPNRRGSILVTLLITVVVFVFFLLASGISYEQAQLERDAERSPQIGNSVDIGGRSLNLFCSGSGQPTVIFESGAPWAFFKDPKTMFETGAPRPGYSWVAIQRESANFTRACWYDRAGTGWSDFGPYPRSSAAQARDLHALLQAAHVTGPYVLVAEASAALDARVYTGLYPQDVVGLVFADGMHPDFFDRSRPGHGRLTRLPGFIWYSQDLSARLFDEVGLYRLLLRDRVPPAPAPKGITDAEWNTIRRLTESAKARAALSQDIAAWQQSTMEARAVTSLGDRTLVVLSSEVTPIKASDQSLWMELQADLAGLSTRGMRRVVQSSPGELIYQAPGAIVSAVRQVVGSVRQ